MDITTTNPSPAAAVTIGAKSSPSMISSGSAAPVAATGAVISPPPPSGGVNPENIVNVAFEWSAPAGFCLSSVNSDSGTNAGGKKPAWNKRSSDDDAEVTPVMGADAWPALSEITKLSLKASSSDSLKNLSEGSTSASQVTGIVSSFSQMQVTSSNENPNSTPNQMVSTRQSSVRRSGGGENSGNSVSTNNSSPQARPPKGLGMESSPKETGKPGSTIAESSSRESIHSEGGQKAGSGSQSRTGIEPYQQRNSYRRGNNGPHPRGNGSYHQNNGGRRDHDRWNQDWNPHRNFGGRDAHMQPQRGPSRPYVRGRPHANPPYIPPPNPMRPPFGTPMMYPEVPSPVFYVPGPYHDPFRAVPVVTPTPPLYFPPLADQQLLTKIVNQINYYFSDDNLVKDIYLRRAMNEQGWVPIKLIADFKKVSQLTDDIQLILFALQFSTTIEVEGEKVRRRNDWTKWLIPSTAQYTSVPNPSLHNSSHDILSAH